MIHSSLDTCVAKIYLDIASIEIEENPVRKSLNKGKVIFSIVVFIYTLYPVLVLFSEVPSKFLKVLFFVTPKLVV
jgi:hypothetical protein